ncbi:coiled-coil domain-containing protein 22 isoform X2 [Achroia grisella]|nr:coiled-coil domain-containing protein 22 isoform X2 [Achroia grisella]XP_059060178.1 coiled-coil domain-containing protein 22 isoform X2 [Achroia grisella]
MFLIERLPNEGKQITPDAIDTNRKSLLLQSIKYKIGEEMNLIWIPPCCNHPGQQTVGDFTNGKENCTQSKVEISLTKEELIQKLLKIKEITTEKQALPITPVHKIKNVCEEKVNVTYETNKSLKELKEIAIHLRQKLDSLESERNVMDVEYSQALKSCERVEGDMKNLQNILNSIGITNIDNEGATDNTLEKVQASINMLHRKSEELTSRNLSLKLEVDKIRNTMALSESERSKCRSALINLKQNAKVMKDEYENKEKIKKQLKINYEKLKGGNKRSIYTKRILEIISNVDKQNMEIKKILEDTRQLQKEINSLEGQLDRCFTIADETLFRDAKKDDQAKKAYKLLALLHSECNTIVSLVNDTGSLARDIVDLEDNIKNENAKRTEDILKKVNLDLTQMQKESIPNNL